MSTVTLSGPLFDGSLPEQVQDFLRAAEDEVAAQASADLHRHMDTFFKRPTPYYETQIAVTRRRSNTVAVHDRGIVYGPWLAGTGTRNAPATKFRGYPHWPLAVEDATQAAPPILQRLAKKHLGGA